MTTTLGSECGPDRRLPGAQSGAVNIVGKARKIGDAQLLASLT
jgi:hypothetical protein